MSKFETELRLPCKQPYAYISVWVRGESLEELDKALYEINNATTMQDLVDLHTKNYDVVMGTKKPIMVAVDMDTRDPRDLIATELGGKVIQEVTNTAPDDSMKAYDVKPWERPKPTVKPKADPNDPFASFK